jgi:hypothetical protein
MADRYECADHIALDELVPREASILIDIGDSLVSPSDMEIRWIAILLEELRGKVACRIALVDESAGKSTSAHLVAYAVRDAVGGVRAFESESDARAWLKS